MIAALEERICTSRPAANLQIDSFLAMLEYCLKEQPGSQKGT